MKTQTLDKLGVSSRFFKPSKEEDNYTNHAPSPQSEAPSIQLVLTEEYIQSHTEKLSQLKAIIESGDWIIKTCCIMSNGSISHDLSIEIRRFRQVLKACDIFLEKDEIKEIGQCTKSFVVIPSDPTEDGIVFEDFIYTLRRVMPEGQENEYNISPRKQPSTSVGDFTDSDEFSDEEPPKKEDDKKRKVSDDHHPKDKEGHKNPEENEIPLADKI